MGFGESSGFQPPFQMGSDLSTVVISGIRYGDCFRSHCKDSDMNQSVQYGRCGCSIGWVPFASKSRTLLRAGLDAWQNMAGGIFWMDGRGFGKDPPKKCSETFCPVFLK